MTETTCLIATVKDEGPWLLEWVAHNQAIGFDRMVIASNDCSDGTDKMLDRLQALGHCRHVPNPPPYDKDWCQYHAYQRARMAPEVATADWVIALDADEFLNIHKGHGTLQEFLDTVEPDIKAVPIIWRVFGDSGTRGWIDGFLTDALTCAATPETNANGAKTLVRDHTAYHGFTAHAPFVPSGAPSSERIAVPMANAAGKRFSPKRLFRGPKHFRYVSRRRATWEGAQINHYMVRNATLFQLKRLRGEAKLTKKPMDRTSPEAFAAHNRNEATDTSIQRTRAARCAAFQRLIADAELSELHHAAIEHAQRVLARLDERSGSTPPFE